MPPASRVGVDSAGGTITGMLQSRHYSDGVALVVVGASVAPHGVGPHAAATMVSGSSRLFVDGIAVVRSGDAASCSHKASGSSRWHSA